MAGSHSREQAGNGDMEFLLLVSELKGQLGLVQSALVNGIISEYSVIIWEYVGTPYFFSPPIRFLCFIHFTVSKRYLCFTSKSPAQRIHQPQCLTLRPVHHAPSNRRSLQALAWSSSMFCSQQ